MPALYGRFVPASVFAFSVTSCATSYSGLVAPISHLSNQPTMCSRRSTRCHGCPERESSWDSPGNFTITVGTLRNLRARNISSPPAAASARDTELFVVDVTALNHFIDAAHEVLIVITGIMILNDVSELLTVGDAAAGIRIKHDVALGRHPLKFVLENPAVGRMGTAV